MLRNYIGLLCCLILLASIQIEDIGWYMDYWGEEVEYYLEWAGCPRVDNTDGRNPRIETSLLNDSGLLVLG